jgi:hypothetical protein
VKRNKTNLADTKVPTMDRTQVIAQKYADLIAFDAQLGPHGHFYIKKTGDSLPLLYHYLAAGDTLEEIAEKLKGLSTEDLERVEAFILELL